MTRLLFFFANLLFIVVNSYAQIDLPQNSENLDEICFCSVGLAHPMSVLVMDNNKELLYALKKNHTINELKNFGISFTKSQLFLLKTMELINQTDSTYNVNIPFLIGQETNDLRRNTATVAREIVAQLGNDFVELFDIIELSGFKSNSYSLIFSFVLDGLVWDILEQKYKIGITEITEDKPFWDGIFWIISPGRKFDCGTNCINEGNYTICETWSNNSIIHISDYQMFGELISDYVKNKKITKSVVIETFKDNAIINDKYELQIPLIKSKKSDKVYTKSKFIAEEIVSYLINKIDYSSVLSDNQNLSTEQKVIITYHEIMWDILELLESNGWVEKPIAFAKPEQAISKDLKDLLYIFRY